MPNKVTSPGWPDPSDWSARLFADLTRKAKAYEGEAGNDQRRYLAACMIGSIVSSLYELPTFREAHVLLPLKDVMIFFEDLRRGRDHPWAHPTKFGGTNVTRTAIAELKSYLKAFSFILRDSGFRINESNKFLAKSLQKSGRKSERNKIISSKTIERWVKEEATRQDAIVKKNIDQIWTDLQSLTNTIRIVDDSGKYLTKKDVASRFVDDFWGVPHLRDRLNSGDSE